MGNHEEIGPQAPLQEVVAPPAQTVVIKQQGESHKLRNGLAAAGVAFLVYHYLFHGGEAPVSHSPVDQNPFAAVSHVIIPNSVNVVEAQQATGKNFFDAYSAACTPTKKVFGHDIIPQGCTPGIGLMTADTGVGVAAHLNETAQSHSVILTAGRDKSQLGWHPELIVNEDAFVSNLSDEIYSDDTLNTGVGNTMTQVAQHQFNNRDADAGDELDFMQTRVSNAVDTACTPVLENYIPAGLDKEAVGWLQQAEGPLAKKDPSGSRWLAKLAKQPLHEEFVTNAQFAALEQSMNPKHTATQKEAPATTTSPSVEPTTAPSTSSESTSETSTYRTPANPETGISIAVPQPVQPIESNTFELILNTKKITYEFHTDSQNCQLAPADQQRLYALETSGNYVIENRPGTSN